MKQKIISFGAVRPAPPGKAAPSRRPRRRRTGRYTLHYLLILLCAGAIIAILSLTVFFRIEEIAVTGITKYAVEEIIEKSGVKKGDNLFRASEKKISERLREAYPYVQKVKLRRTFPPKLTLQIIPEEPLGAAYTQMGYIIVAKSGRVLEVDAQELPDDITVVHGMYFYNPRAGKMLGEGFDKDEQEQAEREQDAFRMLSSLVDAVEQTGFTNITLVDFSDHLNMMIVYDGRVLVELGSEMRLDYKLKFAKRVIEDELEPEFEGVLDASIDKEIWAQPANIVQELEQRRLAVEQREQEQSAAPTENENPELSVIPNESSESSVTSSGVSSIDELAVIPNSSEPDSGSSE